MAGTASLAVGWGLLGDRWLAFVPIAFMAWGDSVAGLLRASLWRGKVAGLWPSVAMFGVCLAVAALYQPYWIGALGALVATVAERRRPRVSIVWDDNLNVVAMSIAVMTVLATVTGV
jgi:dolichol kinase